MKVLLVVVLLASFYQPSKLSNRDCQAIWAPVKAAILSRNIDSTLYFFTDDMVKSYTEHSIKSLRQLISKRWINEPHFIAAIRAGKYRFEGQEQESFQVDITVQFPKAPDEEGDGTLVYILWFKKINQHYKVYRLEEAG
jgi:hypothetical protein